MNKEDVIKLTIETVRKYDAKQKKSRHDRRLYNTRQLLKNYNMLLEHCDESISRVQEIKENPIDILDDIDNLDQNTYIESIIRSNTRTYILMAHVKAMMELLEIYCDKTDNLRKYRVLYNHYVKGETLVDIAKRENIDKRTTYRDINFALEKLSALIFGVDGLALMS